MKLFSRFVVLSVLLLMVGLSSCQVGKTSKEQNETTTLQIGTQTPKQTNTPDPTPTPTSTPLWPIQPITPVPVGLKNLDSADYSSLRLFAELDYGYPLDFVYLPDQEKILALTTTHLLYYDSQTLELLETKKISLLNPHTGVLSPDGRIIAQVDDNENYINIVLFSTDDGSIIKEIKINERNRIDSSDWGPIWDILFLPNGQSVIASQANVVLVWNIETGIMEKRITTEGRCEVLQVSPDGNFIACSHYNKISLYDISKGSKIRDFIFNVGNDPYSSFSIDSFAISPDKKYVAALIFDKYEVVVWDFYTGNLFDVLDTIGLNWCSRFSKQSDITFSHNSEYFVLSDTCGNVNEVNLTTQTVYSFGYGPINPKKIQYSLDDSETVILGDGFLQLIAGDSLSQVKRKGQFGDYLNGFQKQSISPNGKYLVSRYDLPYPIIVTNLSTNEIQTILPVEARDFQISNIDTIFTLASDGSVVEWQISDGKIIRQWKTKDVEGRALSLSPDGTKIAAAYSDGSIDIINLTENQIYFLSMPNNYAITAIDFSPSGKLLTAGAVDGTVIVYDLEKQTILSSIKVIENFDPTDPWPEIDVNSLAISDDDQLLAVGTEMYPGGANWGLSVWNINNGSMLWTQAEDSYAITFTPGSQFVLSFGSFRTKLGYYDAIISHNALTGELQDQTIYDAEFETFFQNYGWGDLQLSSDGNSLFISKDGRAVLYAVNHEIPKSETLYKIAGGGNIQFSSNGKYLLTGGTSNLQYNGQEWVDLGDLAQLWDAENGQKIAEYDAIGNVHFSPDSTQFVLAGKDEGKIIQIADTKLISRFDLKGTDLSAISSDISLLATSGPKKYSRAPNTALFALPSGSIRCVFSTQDILPQPGAIAFSPDNSMLALTWERSTIEIYDTAHCKLIYSLEDNLSEIVQMVFIKNDQILIAENHLIVIKDLQTGAILQSQLLVLSDRVAIKTIAISDDGKLLAVGMDDGNVQLWDLTRNTMIDQWFIHPGEAITSLAFSSDRSKLAVSFGQPGTTYVYDISWFTIDPSE